MRPDKSLSFFTPLKGKKNIGYILSREGVILFFLIENRILRKTIKKFKSFSEKTAVE
jgi:hypothetical protein